MTAGWSGQNHEVKDMELLGQVIDNVPGESDLNGHGRFGSRRRDDVLALRFHWQCETPNAITAAANFVSPIGLLAELFLVTPHAARMMISPPRTA